MAKVFTFQDPGEGIHEAEVLRVLVSLNDKVKEGQEVFEVETDKANFDLSCPYDGVVTEIHVREGDRIQVGDALMTVNGDGERAEKPSGTSTSEEQARQESPGEHGGESAAPRRKERDEKPGRQPPLPAECSAEPQSQAKKEERSSSTCDEPVPASPATRRVARELNVDLREVTPSGEKGRVLTSDVRAFAESRITPDLEKEKARPKDQEARERPVRVTVPALPDFAQWGPVTRIPLRSVRRETAKRMALSWSQIPHVTHNDVADISELETFRQRHVGEIAAKGGKLTLTVLIMKAVVGALHEFPSFNASLDFEAEEIVLKSYYHLGVALDSERGLLVPVVRDVDRKSVSDLAVELFELAQRVRKGKVSREEMMGSTFTITNPGPLGGTGFTPIINFPDVAILGLGRARLQPVVFGTMEDPEIRARLLLPLSLAFDHRVNDGAMAARFVNRLIQALSDLETFALMV